MKKVLIVLAMFSVIILTSCTDNTENLIEKDATQGEANMSDKDEEGDR